eukprot:CFRG2909T1
MSATSTVSPSTPPEMSDMSSFSSSSTKEERTSNVSMNKFLPAKTQLAGLPIDVDDFLTLNPEFLNTVDAAHELSDLVSQEISSISEAANDLHNASLAYAKAFSNFKGRVCKISSISVMDEDQKTPLRALGSILTTYDHYNIYLTQLDMLLVEPLSALEQGMVYFGGEKKKIVKLNSEYLGNLEKYLKSKPTDSEAIVNKRLEITVQTRNELQKEYISYSSQLATVGKSNITSFARIVLGYISALFAHGHNVHTLFLASDKMTSKMFHNISSMHRFYHGPFAEHNSRVCDLAREKVNIAKEFDLQKPVDTNSNKQTQYYSQTSTPRIATQSHTQNASPDVCLKLEEDNMSMKEKGNMCVNADRIDVDGEELQTISLCAPDTKTNRTPDSANTMVESHFSIVENRASNSVDREGTSVDTNLSTNMTNTDSTNISKEVSLDGGSHTPTPTPTPSNLSEQTKTFLGSIFKVSRTQNENETSLNNDKNEGEDDSTSLRSEDHVNSINQLKTSSFSKWFEKIRGPSPIPAPLVESPYKKDPKKGYLYVKNSSSLSRTTWSRQFMCIRPDDSKLYRVENDINVEVADLVLCEAKPTAKLQERLFTFDLIAPYSTLELQAFSEDDRMDWIRAMTACKTCALESPVFKLPASPKMGANDTEVVHATRLKARLSGISGNTVCVDCEAADPQWASLNLGVLMCLECAGAHRSLGVMYSQVRSITLDSWNEENLHRVERIGNAKSNSSFEAKLENRSVKMNMKSNPNERLGFIRSKYVDKLWHHDAKLSTVESESDGEQVLFTGESLEFLPASSTAQQLINIDQPLNNYTTNTTSAHTGVGNNKTYGVTIDFSERLPTTLSGTTVLSSEDSHNVNSIDVSSSFLSPARKKDISPDAIFTTGKGSVMDMSHVPTNRLLEPRTNGEAPSIYTRRVSNSDMHTADSVSMASAVMESSDSESG